MVKYYISILLLFLTESVIGQSEINPQDFIPKENEIGNWIIKDSAQVYTAENLYEYKNTGADLYLEYGFKKVISGYYRNPLYNTIHVEIYEMENNEAAYGVFTVNSSAKGKPVEFGNEGIQYDYYLHFWKGDYFVRVTVNNRKNGMMDTLLIFSEFVDDKIQSKSKKPQLVTSLDELNFQKVKYIKGTIGLGNVYNFGHGTITGFNEGLIGKSEEKMIFVFGYKDDRSRREWYYSAKGKIQTYDDFSDYTDQENGFSANDKAGTPFCFKPYRKYLIVIKGLNWEEAQSLFEQIESKLP
ncbi:MAG: hypothetical protein K8R37_10550 [Bacteroidales bacterium]|nr:hypothetical protein [Bacteroidales bacterium]